MAAVDLDSQHFYQHPTKAGVNGLPLPDRSDKDLQYTAKNDCNEVPRPRSRRGECKQKPIVLDDERSKDGDTQGAGRVPGNVPDDGQKADSGNSILANGSATSEKQNGQTSKCFEVHKENPFSLPAPSTSPSVTVSTSISDPFHSALYENDAGKSTDESHKNIESAPLASEGKEDAEAGGQTIAIELNTKSTFEPDDRQDKGLDISSDTDDDFWLRLFQKPEFKYSPGYAPNNNRKGIGSDCGKTVSSRDITPEVRGVQDGRQEAGSGSSILTNDGGTSDDQNGPFSGERSPISSPSTSVAGSEAGRFTFQEKNAHSTSPTASADTIPTPPASIPSTSSISSVTSTATSDAPPLHPSPPRLPLYDKRTVESRDGNHNDVELALSACKDKTDLCGDVEGEVDNEMEDPEGDNSKRNTSSIRSTRKRRRSNTVEDFPSRPRIKRRRRAVPHRNGAAGNHGTPRLPGHQYIDTDDDSISPETKDDTPGVRKANARPGLAGSATAGGANLSLPLPKPDRADTEEQE